MGNSSTSLVKTAITNRDSSALGCLLQNPLVRLRINDPLNRKGDTALSLAIRMEQYEFVVPLLEAGADVNTINKDNETPIDILLRTLLPEDEDILHNHCCVMCPEVDTFQIPEILKILLKAGAKGASIQRLVLYSMKDSDVVMELCKLIVDLQNPKHFRLSGLLLQVAVWFDLHDCLLTILTLGVDIENFWRSSFIPMLVPNKSYRPAPWSKGESAEYVLPSLPDSYAIQTLKLSFVQDWRAEWDDGCNPSAQYRAGLHLTPESALIFAKSANKYEGFVRIMDDVRHYLPCSCSGPKLKDMDLVNTLALAGYLFTEEEITHLQLKFNVDFESYFRYQRQPKPLRHITRTAVRFSMKTNVFCGVNQVTCLPNSLKDFILLQDGNLNF